MGVAIFLGVGRLWGGIMRCTLCITPPTVPGVQSTMYGGCYALFYCFVFGGSGWGCCRGG